MRYYGTISRRPGARRARRHALRRFDHLALHLFSCAFPSHHILQPMTSLTGCGTLPLRFVRSVGRPLELDCRVFWRGRNLGEGRTNLEGRPPVTKRRQATVLLRFGRRKDGPEDARVKSKALVESGDRWRVGIEPHRPVAEFTQTSPVSILAPLPALLHSGASAQATYSPMVLEPSPRFIRCGRFRFPQ